MGIDLEARVPGINASLDTSSLMILLGSTYRTLIKTLGFLIRFRH